MQKTDSFDIGDFVRLDSSFTPSYKSGTICEIVNVSTVQKTNQVQVFPLSPTSYAKDRQHSQFTADLSTLTLLSREEQAQVFDNRALAIEQQIPTLQAAADKHKKKAALLRKYKNSRQELAAEFYEVIVNSPDRNKKLENLQKALEGRVKEQLL